MQESVPPSTDPTSQLRDYTLAKQRVTDCVRESNIPKKKWNVPMNTKTIEKYFQGSRIIPYKYHSSYVFEVYDTFDDLNWSKVELDLDNLINKYKELVS